VPPPLSLLPEIPLKMKEDEEERRGRREEGMSPSVPVPSI
jgi:hypothetical protein